MTAKADEYDSLYREGLDGFIGVRFAPDELDESGKRLEFIIIVDLSVLDDKKQAEELAMKM